MARPPSEREIRVAENESRFRDINHRLAADLEAIGTDGDAVGFVCECGRPRCTAEVPLSIAEYRAVREDPMLFAVLPDHQIEDVEDVVRRGERFLVVRKHEPTRPVVERTDPT